MKLAQNQVWKQGDEYFRIVVLERLEVQYKKMSDLRTRAGRHVHATKKEFCRLIKGATLLSEEEVRVIAAQQDAEEDLEALPVASAESEAERAEE